MRQCPDVLVEYLDAKIVTPNTSPVILLLQTAQACVGITEVGGDNKGPMVEAFQSSVGTPEAQSWCMDFVQALVAYVELKCGIQSMLPVSEGVLPLWDMAHEDLSPISPSPGDLILWQLGATPHGHCGIVTGMDPSHYFTIEGNTSSAKEIDRNGDGVYSKTRLKGGSVTFRQVGFLRAFT